MKKQIVKIKDLVIENKSEIIVGLGSLALVILGGAMQKVVTNILDDMVWDSLYENTELKAGEQLVENRDGDFYVMTDTPNKEM